MPASRSMSSACFGASASVMTVDIRDSGQTTRLPRGANFELSASTTSWSARLISLVSARAIKGSPSITPSGPIEMALMNMREAE